MNKRESVMVSASLDSSCEQSSKSLPKDAETMTEANKRMCARYKIIMYFFCGFIVSCLQANSFDLADRANLQRGAKLYMDYCSGCHALKYMRYNRMATDLGLTIFAGHGDNKSVLSNQIFTTSTENDPIQISMPERDARQWFGRLPPDLSLSARERGAGWLNAYLNGFYADPRRPFGANNVLVPGLTMPNVLDPMQRSMSKLQFDRNIEDLVAFMVYVSEPVKLMRYRLGIAVTLFLCIFLLVVCSLKRYFT